MTDRERLEFMGRGRSRSGKAQDGLEGLGLFQVTLEQAIAASERRDTEEGHKDE